MIRMAVTSFFVEDQGKAHASLHQGSRLRAGVIGPVFDDTCATSPGPAGSFGHGAVERSLHAFFMKMR
jgi:hypothetical protein